MSSEQSRMRTTLLGSLLDNAARNRARGAGALRLFEAGAVYLPVVGQPLPREPYHVAGLLAGAARPPSWREPDPRRADFFSVKGVVGGLLHALGTELTLQRANEPFLHPGRQAEITVGGRGVGWLGEVHPLVAADWDLHDTIAAFELDLDAVPVAGTPAYEDLSTFPEVREDLSVIVAESVSADQIRDVILRAGAPLVRSADVFDVYRDPERIGTGHVSLALALTYRAPDRTLTDEEVAERRDAIAAALEAELGGRIRAS
jgi:phenylalanyl-tRNA synthetase beta chain